MQLTEFVPMRQPPIGAFRWEASNEKNFPVPKPKKQAPAKAAKKAAPKKKK